MEHLQWRQSSLQKKIDNSSQKVHKSRYQTFVVLSDFTRFPYFVKYILSGVLGTHCKICLKEVSLNVSSDSRN